MSLKEKIIELDNLRKELAFNQQDFPNKVINFIFQFQQTVQTKLGIIEYLEKEIKELEKLEQQKLKQQKLEQKNQEGGDKIE